MNDKKKKQTKRWKRRLKKFIIFLIVLIILAAAGLYAYDAMKKEYTVTYTPYTATIGTISNSLSFSGSLQLINNKTYQAASASTVKTVYVSEGDSVKKGDKLVRLANGESITADFDGRVNQLYVEKDDDISMGGQLVQVADFSRMKVSIRVDEYDISSVSVGQRCVVTATATENKFESSIDSINYISASAGNVAYYTGIAYVDVPADSGVYPGMQVTITIPQEEANDVVVLKEDALSFDRSNQAFVYIKNDVGEMEQKNVTVGVSNGNYVEIKDGVKDGDTVYVVAEKTESTGLVSSLMSGVFGGTQINGMGGGNMPSFGGSGGSMPNFDSGSMPSFGGGSGGGNGGSGGGNGGGRGMPGGFGGGGRP